MVAALLDRFRGDKGLQLLQSRGSLVIRRLCSLLGPEKVFTTVSHLLVREQDLPFASTMVQALNLILLTAPELKQPRNALKNVVAHTHGHLHHHHHDSAHSSSSSSATPLASPMASGSHGKTPTAVEMFEALYRSFSHSCCATLSLCLHAGAYAHACEVIDCLGTDLDISDHILLELDRLVRLIESPMFTAVRLKLLDPAKHPALCKCLYGILTLLPQSKAWDTLNRRLESVPSDKLVMLSDLITGESSLDHASAKERKKEKSGTGFKHLGKSKSRTQDHAGDNGAEGHIHFDRLLHVFYHCQSKHGKLHN
uniref:Vacuolar protein 14 C-terminal Fig4-binding domain-containing protein n=1 Tax=Chloropicon laureae TaxID=464258 RepID=A0A7S2Z3C3_9CHLO